MERLDLIAQYIRTLILRASSQAGSGHPTSALSAADLMTGLMFGGSFRYDADHPGNPNNDRLIFSKGHATPLYYALWAAAGALTEEDMLTYRRFGSPLEGHPTPAFRYVDAATGSLGQGLSIGLGMALNAKYLDKLSCRTYVLLGDSEMAEGAQWEALQIAAHYRLDNLVGILDVNRLGQRGETMYGRDAAAHRERIAAFGWRTRVIAGHAMDDIVDACRWAAEADRPSMIIAETVKGKGVSFLEDRDGWHGKALDEEQLARALDELGKPDRTVRGSFAPPDSAAPATFARGDSAPLEYEQGASVPTRNAYGKALARICPQYPSLVALDGEVCNSTRAQYLRDVHPERFFEMYVAEQNMVGAAVGLSSRGRVPFVSTFAAFLTRAFDQIRMARYSDANIKFVGSHAGVSIGQDGPSQMGLEDIAMFRTILDGVVLYPCDAVSTERLVEAMAEHRGMAYLRTTRGGTPVIYAPDETFPIGGSKVLRQSEEDRVAVVGAGITVHEALAAYDTLHGAGIPIRVIDLYSVKPLDAETLQAAVSDTEAVLVVEDHYAAGGIGEAVAAALAGSGTAVHSLCVRRKPKSGTTQELLDDEGISAAAIAAKVKQLAGRA